MKKTNNLHHPNVLLALLAIILSSFSFQSCEKEEPAVTSVRNIANEEFYKLMKEWYYWHDAIPQLNPADYANPAALLESIRKLPEDRWSYVTSKAAFEALFVRSTMFGHGFASGYDASGNLRVLFVFNRSDLFPAGVRRGWVIRAINDRPIAPGTNISALLGPNQDGFANTFTFDRPAAADTTITSRKGEIVMNNVLHNEIIHKDGLKIGYMILNGFTGPTRAEIDTAFNYFYNNRTDELILDLRYNGGGQTDIALHLASRIAGNNIAGRPFANYIFNELKATLHNKTESFLTLDKGLNLSRLTVITTDATASASEMIINGLRPFIPVTVVGTATYGKPMGMYAWTYADFAFVPITFKITNSEGFGDYFNGLPANIAAMDDISRNFGDPLESSLQQALAFITSGVPKSMPVVNIPYKQPRDFMTGLDAIIGAH